jgi:hypothetical protein
MTREQKMQAVVDAIRAADAALEGVRVVLADMSPSTLARLKTARLLLNRALGHTQTLAALDALPAEPQPQGETVTLAVWEYEDGETYLCKPGSEMDDRGSRWTRLGTVRLPLDRERGE